MPAIGMIGNNAVEMANIFFRMCQSGGYAVERVDGGMLLASGDGGLIQVGCVDGENPARVDILVAQGMTSALAQAVSRLTAQDYFIINADKKEIFSVLKNNAARLITYGFNGRACVTASSVTDSELQICIQRSLTSMHGRTREPQEFPTPVDAGVNASDVLGAVAAGVVCDII